jgi:ribonuclease G
MGETELEETVFAVNLQAAQEIAHQVRLRNIGGIITVDFIDMQKEEHRRAVTEMLQACLSQDKAKCNVLEMNEFCITQFTRKRVGRDLLSFLVKPCPYCNANGHVHGDIYVQTRLRSAILDCLAAGYTAAIVHLNIEMMHKILNGGLFTKEVETIWQDKRVYLIPHRTYGETQFDVHGENASVLNLPDNAQILY